MKDRRWYWHRQAYGPRWSVAMLSGMAIGATVWFIAALLFPWTWTTVLGAFVVQLVLAIGVQSWRWARWSRRHPVLSRDELRGLISRTAPWN